jgi:hypothetical protein
MKGYIITGRYYTDTKVYTNKAKAEEACKYKNYCIILCGGRETVHVKEVEIITEEEEK